MTLYRQILLLTGDRSVPYDYCVLSPRQRGLVIEVIIPLKLGLMASCGVREIKGQGFWSATTQSNNTANAWRVNLHNGNTNNNDKTNSNRILCVSP